MQIKSLMIKNPITISEQASIQDALDIMNQHSIRHLPVVTKEGRFIGFVTLTDIKQAFIPSMVSDLSLKDIMVKDPIVLSPDADIETAVRIIYKHKIGGIPVVENNKLAGIITITDLLEAFANMLGILTKSVRVDVNLDNNPMGFHEVSRIIQSNGGQIISVGISPQKIDQNVYCFRLQPCDTEQIAQALKKSGYKIVGIEGL
ncbi:MAG: CBS domain-containing protein [Pseudomonadota bacterium]